MIRRGKDPESHFQILPNATVRDRRLSFRARGLLAFMLSFPENWRFRREWLAGQSDKDGEHAVRSALTELEKAGYLVRRKVRVNGRFDWEQILYRNPQTVSAGETRGGLPPGGIPADGDHPGKEDGYEDSQEDFETDDAPRSQARAAATFEDQDSIDEIGWREQDLALFKSLVGDKVTSDGSGNWKEGVWSAEAFYRSFRKGRRKKWPGRWLQRISENDTDLQYWQLNEGLEIG